MTRETSIAFGVAPGKWILDSGATDHMVHEKSRLQIAEANPVAESVGMVKINMQIKGQWKDVMVNDVLYVPELQCNLFSVRRLEDIGMSLKFACGKVCNGRIVGGGRRSGQCYVLNVVRDDKATGGQFQWGGRRGSCRSGGGGR